MTNSTRHTSASPNGTKKILFIAPHSNTSIMSKSFTGNKLFGKRAFSPPIALATINAITPGTFETHIWDEDIAGAVTDYVETISEYDIIALTGYVVHRKRILEIATAVRNMGKMIIAGGADITASSEIYRDYFDVLFLGESERTWPQFLKDYYTNTYQDKYVEHDIIDISESPEPDWGNLSVDMGKYYLVGAVQSTRGCPFRCDFCNVWKVFGQKVRNKQIEQVISEMQTLIDYGCTTISFANDNLIGNMKYAKELVREIIKLNKTSPSQMSYYAELSLNVAKDDEMLALMAEAGFSSLFIGIESPNEASLKETKKYQNLKSNLTDTCKKIMSYGMLVEGSMIVGFDQDQHDIFDSHFNFLMEAHIPLPWMHVLKARKGTELWNTLEKQNRLLDYETAGISINKQYANISNIIPKNFTREELYYKYIELVEKLMSWENFYKRLFDFLENIDKIEAKSDRTTLNQLPPELIFVTESFEIEHRKDIEKALLFTLNKYPKLIYPIVSLLIRYKAVVNQFPHVKKEIIDDIESTKHLVN
jgi:radical SAM superfamily enzyme YgiQ (UPF0313 family)